MIALGTAPAGAADNPLVWTCAVLLLVLILQSARLGWRTRQRDVYLRLLKSLAAERTNFHRSPRLQLDPPAPKTETKGHE